MVQSDKKFCPSRSISQEPYIMWFWFMVHMCKVIITPGSISIFSKFWFFRLLGGGGERSKVQKLVQNDKNFCLSRSVSQKLNIIWFSFKSHLCKMIISPGGFSIFTKFWFFGLLRGKKAKNSPKWQKILSVVLHISGTIHHMTVIYGTHL